MSALPPHTTSHPHARGLTWRGPALVAGAIALGLLLFAWLWWRDRQSGFYQPPVAPAPAAGQPYEALPAPLPAGEAANASGMGREEAASANAPHPPAPVRAPAVPSPAPNAAPGETAMAPGSDPVPVSRPAPRYPPEALRNQASGTVLLAVEVGADGVPTQVVVARSSHSRSLDRAASDAVHQWRFHPAQRNGRPVPGRVQVPVTFNLGE
ncbi:MAG: TonB family protein [Lysobacter sp.]|nr:TonB family protein [Lysobacter sp.]